MTKTCLLAEKSDLTLKYYHGQLYPIITQFECNFNKRQSINRYKWKIKRTVFKQYRIYIQTERDLC